MSVNREGLSKMENVDPASGSTVNRKHPREQTACPVIQLEGLTKRYGSLVVVDNVDLQVMKGEVYAIIGPSGAGKSTLLRCVNHLEAPNEGQITVGSVSHNAEAPISAREINMLRRSAGMVFQSFNLFPHMTILRNVSLAQERTLGRSRKEADSISKALLERVGLADKVNEYPRRCSGGQQQRVGIARALALEPQVMLFDEPTSALDPELGLEVLSVMRELAHSGMTMLVVTHEIRFAEKVADHVMIMADGKPIEKGTAADVINNPQHERSRRFLKAVNER